MSYTEINKQFENSEKSIQNSYAENISITVHQAKSKKRKKYKIIKYVYQPDALLTLNAYRNPRLSIGKHYSMSKIVDTNKKKQAISRKSDTAFQKSHNKFLSKYIVDLISEYRSNPFYNPMTHTRVKVYRCQLNTNEESCCCSCNSDAMFEVMKSLYDCYKKKNCDHCNCILCGHLPREERRLGELRKSATRVVGEKEKKVKLKKAEQALEGKSIAEKEKIMKDLVKSGIPLPEPKTASEKELVKKLTTEYGLPPEARTVSEKARMKKAEAAGLITPLSGKTPSEKEKILKKQAELGISLPKGRTPSEKALIEKVKTTAKEPSPKIPSEKWRKAKADGILTPLEGKPPEQKEKILKSLAIQGLPLPEGKTDSEKKLIDKVRTDIGLPPEPKTRSMKEKYNKALSAGLMLPLEGKSSSEKEKILQGLADMGIPLPEGRTSSEKALIKNVNTTARAPLVVAAPSEKLRRAKAAGLLTPLEGKTPEQKENIFRGLASQGLALPEGKTASERNLIDKVRTDMGLPPEPKSPSMREKYNKAAEVGLMLPLEGKSPLEKEKILRGLTDMGIPLPEGRTLSEKNIISKIKADTRPPAEGVALSEKLKKAKATGLLTPLEGKNPEQKENILKGLAMKGVLLPEPKTPSEKRIIEKVRADLGLPSEPKTFNEKSKYKKAVEAGIITPLQGKTPSQKEKILRKQYDMGLTLPEGRSPSEKALIEQITSDKRKKAKMRGVGVDTSALSEGQRRKLDIKTAKVIKEGKGPVDECICGVLIPDSEKEVIEGSKTRLGKLKESKTGSLLRFLEGKTPEQKEKTLKTLVKRGLPIPEAKTASEKHLIDKVRKEIGLPPEPTTVSMKEKYVKAQAAGYMTPLEGKTNSQKEKILKGQAEMGIPLPEGRSASEKTLINKVKATKTLSITSEKLRKAKAAGLLTPLEGKTSQQKEKILKGLAQSGLPLPEGKTPSEKAMIRKIKTAAGIPDATVSEKIRKAKAAGLLTPLEGKTKSQKEKILRGRAVAGLPLSEGKTQSEKQLIKRIKADTGYITPTPSERMKRAKAAGLLTPLEGKTLSQKAKIIKQRLAVDLPSPEGKTKSEKELIRKVETGMRALPIRKTPSERLKQAKATGLLTPLDAKTPEQKEKILNGLIKAGIPLPEPKTVSEKELINKVRLQTGLPPEPKTPAIREKYRKAQAAGIITPLEDKTSSQKEKALKKMHDAGIPLPEGRTASEKAIIQRVKAGLVTSKVQIPSEKLRAAKIEGLLTPLEGKTPEQKEKILKGLAKAGIPLPEAKTASDKTLIKKVRSELGLPPEPQTSSMKEKVRKAQAAGLITPLEGKSPSQKEKILRNLAEAGVTLPKGRSPSEKAMISKIQDEITATGSIRHPSRVGLPALPPDKVRKLDEKSAKVMKEGRGPADECICGLLTPKSERKPPMEKLPSKTLSEKMKKARAGGLLTPLKGKSLEQKEKILKGLAQQGLALPVAETESEKKIIKKVRKELGLPPEPETVSERKRYDKAIAAGKILPLEGKSPSVKERILKSQAAMGIPLPEGRTPSEKALIKKVTLETKPIVKIPSEKLRQAKAAGLLTPLEGKTQLQKENILKELAMLGLPIPEPRTTSDRKLTEKVRAELGLPPEPKSPSERRKYDEAASAGVIVPLEGKTISEKVKTLRAQAEMGLPLPQGRTPSEKALIEKIKTEVKVPSKSLIPSEKIRKAKAAGLFTPLEGKPPEQKEKILRGIATAGIPLPEAKTASEKKIIDKVRTELGLPPKPKTPLERKKYESAIASGLIVPLEGKTSSEKAKTLRAQAEMGLTLPQGRTSSEKDLIEKIKAEVKMAPKIRLPSEKVHKAKAAGLLTPLEGKSPEKKEKILRGLVTAGLPLPEAKTASEKKLIDKIRTDLGLPPEPKTLSERRKYDEAVATGIIVPLKGKSASEKEKTLRAQAEIGLPLPEGRTLSEKALIEKIKNEVKARSKIRIPSEKIRKAREAGLLTPLKEKLPEQKEKILKGLAMQGLPLPEGKTKSEKELIQKVRTDLGLPFEPKSPSEKVKYDKAVAAGIVKPLEGLTTAEKAQTLRAQADMNISLPEGRTKSEKFLIAKIRAETKGTPSEKLTKAKTSSEKEEVLKAIADSGIPLPEGKTPSEKAIIQKIKEKIEKRPPSRRVGVPALPLEKARKLDEKTAKIIKEGKGPVDECICDLLTPEIERIGPIKLPMKVSSTKLRAAKAAGVLTPLEGKTPAQKEKIMRGLAIQGLPIPEPKTASERKLADKVRTELGLPPEPKTSSERRKYIEGITTGKILPLEGKTPSEKAKILKSQVALGLPLPEGRTSSEKALIAKIKAEAKASSKIRISSEKMRKAKAAGLITPLEGKTPLEKEKILKGLAVQGLPFPEAKTVSDRKLSDRVRKELGLPPEPKEPSEKKRYEKAIASGVIVPLEKLSPKMKEKTLRAQADMGLALPEGRTSSEKKLIAKVIAESKAPTKIPSEKLRKAKTAGLLTPLEGKSVAEKEKIIRGLAEVGIPLPEGKTRSEKSMIHKIKTELGIPPPAKTPSEKELIREAKAEGLFTPLAGKSIAHKEKILKGLAEAGLPMPEGKTQSEKELVKKIRTGTGLPPEASPSEKKGRIKLKSKKIGAGAMRSSRKIGVGKHKVEGIGEEFEDIIKTTTCDRGCGCDRKKIRFKHSYVKIKVTSPDISSLCPCPDECIPGVKSGIFTDNEGIKVTIGNVVGVPSYFRKLTHNDKSGDKIIYSYDYNSANSVSTFAYYSKKNHAGKSHKSNEYYNKDKIEYIYKHHTMFTNSEENLKDQKTNINENYRPASYLYKFDYRTEKFNILFKNTNIVESPNDTATETASVNSSLYSQCSSNNVWIIKTESYLCLSTSSCTQSRSVFSFVDSNFVSNSSNYLCYSVSDDYSSEEGSDYYSNFKYKRNSMLRNLVNSRFNYKHNMNKIENGFKVIRISQSKSDNKNCIKGENNLTTINKKNESVILCNNTKNDQDIMTMMDELLTSKEFTGTSSIYVVVSSSDEESVASDLNDSEIYLHISEEKPKLSISTQLGSKASSTACALKINVLKPKINSKFTNPKRSLLLKSSEEIKSELNIAQKNNIKYYPNASVQKSEIDQSTRIIKGKHHIFSTDTTQDRPCCCPPNERCPIRVLSNYKLNPQCVASVVSETTSAKKLTHKISQDIGAVDLSLPTQTSFSIYNSHMPQTATTMCRVPKCRGHTECYNDLTRQFATNTGSPGQVNFLPDSARSQQREFGCGGPKMMSESIPHNDTPTVKNCGCTMPKPITDTNRNKENKRKVKLKQPFTCGEKCSQILGTNLNKAVGTKSIGNQCCSCESVKIRTERCVGIEQRVGTEDRVIEKPQLCIEGQLATETEKEKCICKKKAGKKGKIICECPPEPEPEPEPELDYLAYADNEIDLKGKWKLQSELTQTTSGFKVDLKRKKDVESEMSFEDALAYYASINPELETTELQENCKCEYMKNKKKSSVQCECPEQPPSPFTEPDEEAMEEPFKGFKFTMSGKGSASKGLSGICCFDMYEESKTYMVGYLDERDSNYESDLSN